MQIQRILKAISYMNSVMSRNCSIWDPASRRCTKLQMFLPKQMITFTDVINICWLDVMLRIFCHGSSSVKLNKRQHRDKITDYQGLLLLILSKTKMNTVATGEQPASNRISLHRIRRWNGNPRVGIKLSSMFETRNCACSRWQHLTGNLKSPQAKESQHRRQQHRGVTIR